MEAAVQDLRTSWRTLRAHPGLTITLILILGLGIGANCALFTVVSSLFLRPLPYERVDQLVEIHQPQRVFALEDLRKAQTIAGVGAFHARGFTVAGTDGLRNFFGFRVSANLFDVLGVKAAVGRTFRPDEETAPVVVLGYEYWRRTSGDPGIIGQSLSIADEIRTVIGVLPPDFVLQVRDGNLFIPYRLTEGRTVARLQPTATIASANAEVTSILKQVIPAERLHQFPAQAPVEPAARSFRPNAEMVVILQVAVGLLLLITCANAGNILLVRANARRREFAIRTALGAGRLRVLRQLVLENVIVAVFSAIAGLLFANWSLAFVEKQLPGNLVRMLRGTEALSIDTRVLWFAIGLAALTVVVFGSAPALAAMRVDVVSALRAIGTGDGSRRHSAQILAIAEIALAVMLLVGAGLMGKSLLQLENRYLGFTAEHVLRTSVDLPALQYPDPAKREILLQSLVERLGSLPGVERVGMVGPQLYPFSGPRIGGSEFVIRGRATPTPPRAEVFIATPEYFRTLEIPLLRGRGFTPADHASAQPIALISESAAKRYWPDEDPVGAVIRLNAADPASPWVTVVGIVGSVKNPVGVDVQMHAYRPFAQSAASGGTIVIRTAGDPMTFAPTAIREIRNLIPNVPEPRAVLLADTVRDYISPQRFSASVMGIFSVLGLAIAVAGVYGVTRQWVAGRISEIGIRMALGALPTAILKLVMRQCAITVFWGVALGLLGAMSLEKLIASQVVGVSTADPAVVGSVVAAITMASLAAAFSPALWASRIDPLVALKYE